MTAALATVHDSLGNFDVACFGERIENLVITPCDTDPGCSNTAMCSVGHAKPGSARPQ